MEVGGMRPRGRPKKSWLELVGSDMRDKGLKRQDALARNEWRAGINHKVRRRTKVETNPGNLETVFK